MPQESAMRARVDGRAKVAARTVWTLEIGALTARCLRQDDGTFIVQGRTSKGWTAEIGKGADAQTLLVCVVKSKGVATALAAKAKDEDL